MTELELQHSNLQELLGALTDPTTVTAAARLTEWHARLGEARLREMKTSRENTRFVFYSTQFETDNFLHVYM